MTYEELQDILKLRQRTPQGAVPTLNEILDAIQSQYQPQTMAVQPATQGAQRFVSDVQSFGPIERMTEYGGQPVSATPMAAFTPGAFDINRTSYVPDPTAAQLAARMGDTGGSSGTVPLSAQQEAVFNFMNTPQGQSYKDAFGKANSNLIGSVLPAFVPGLGLYNLAMGKTTNPISAFKDANNAWNSALQAMQSDITNYGVSPNAMGPTTAAQAQALVDALASQLSSSYSSGGYGDPSQSYSGGDSTSASSADSTAADNSGVGGW
jgi:hypothetical protein